MLAQGLGRLGMAFALILGGEHQAAIFQQAQEARLVFLLETRGLHLDLDDVNHVLPLPASAVELGTGNRVGAVVVDDDL